MLVLFCFAVALQGQVADLTKDPNITWLAVYEADFFFSPTEKSQPDERFLLRKLALPSEDECKAWNSTNWVFDWIYWHYLHPESKLYADADLSRPLSKAEISSLLTTIDTIITFDSETYEELIQVVRNDLNPADIQSVRVKQALYYNQGKGVFDTRVLALAPLVTITDPTGKPIGKKQVAWIPMDGKMPINFSQKDPDIVWIGQTIGNSSWLDLKTLNVVKNSLKQTLVETIHSEALSGNHKVENHAGYGCGNFLMQEELKRTFGSYVDTVITFDPATFEETMQVTRYDLAPSDIDKIRLVQEWYFDNRRKQLFNRVLAVCPMFTKREKKGRSDAYFPLYYLRT